MRTPDLQLSNCQTKKRRRISLRLGSEIAANRSVDGVFESLASLESGHIGRRYFDFFIGPRIAPGTGWAMLDSEGAETCDGDRIAFAQGADNTRKRSIERPGSACAGNVRGLGDPVDQIGFIHDIPLVICVSNFARRI
jgi:hypothetical protein